ncbi:MAG: GAF domain-containing protein [Spirirestis rafaelensis WJT71-NPBG6]|jgi:GAF domain-containing protein|nr:GAF domain-containing protein [Spirirestis rafaelensis WJT71-NPBG6]
MTDVIPENLQNILDKYSEPDAMFAALLPTLGEILQCDRIFLYLRNPETKMGKIDYSWRRNSDIPLAKDIDWKPEPAHLPEKDPLFAAALRTEPSIFVEDVETADPKVLNREFERSEFGHRALIHAHLCWENQLWGVLQPCIFGNKRVWSESDRAVINQVVSKIVPLAVAFVKAATVKQ